MSRVLVVEDSPTQAQEIQLLLEDAGLQVDLAADGVQALERIQRAMPDIVATDLEMPKINGLQLVEAIRCKHADLPVILMTAHGSEEIAALALRKGAASYVPKAYLEQDIVSTLERILALTRLDRCHARALECLAETQSQYILNNDSALIPPLIGHLEELLIRLNLCDATERMRVGVALQEALLNAMMHGNLEVSSELRQQDEKTYFAAVEERRHQSPYRTRRVFVAVKATPGKISYVVRDEGPGFDPSILPDPTDPANLEHVGGRGLLLIRTFMSTVYHNERGNEITLIKNRDP
jgi:CheY-like chemotaxis protein/anti-sigma regulatory factor (Ser/Thr protein kinase)